MQRRDFIALVAGAAAARPFAAHSEPQRIRVVAVLNNFAADDPEGQVRLTVFAQSLQQLGWTVGRNSGSATAGAQATQSVFARECRR
jgi:hypothetical protein